MFLELVSTQIDSASEKNKINKGIIKGGIKTQPLTVIKVIAIIFINLEHLTVKKNFEIKIKALSKEKTKHNY